MRLNFCAAWIVVALCSACGRSRALPVPDGGNGGTASTPGSAGAGTSIPDPQGGGGTGGAGADDVGLGGAGGVGGTTGGAGLEGVGGTTGGAGLGGVGGTTGGAGLGGAGATTGGAGLGGVGGGLGGSAGGTGGAAGTAGDMPDCPPMPTPGQRCVVGSVCRNAAQCHACSDRYWRLVGERPPCLCDSTGSWWCSGRPPDHAVDCFFDPPLDCDLAQSLYEDATCQTHPPCSASPPP